MTLRRVEYLKNTSHCIDAALSSSILAYLRQLAKLDLIAVTDRDAIEENMSQGISWVL